MPPVPEPMDDTRRHAQRGELQVATGDPVALPGVSSISPAVAAELPRSAAGEATLRPRELGGPKGLEPTRYGDWERGGRCIDF